MTTNKSEIVIASRVNPEKPASPTSVQQCVPPEEGERRLPSSDNHSLIIPYNDYRDVTTINQNRDSFKQYRDIPPSNGARPIYDNKVGLPRPPRSTSRSKYSSPTDAHRIDSKENEKPDCIIDILHTEDHQGDSKLKRAKQWLCKNGSYIKSFIKTVLLLIVVYAIFLLFYFISVSLRTPVEEEVQYPQHQISHMVTEYLIHYIQFDIVVLRLIFTGLLTIGKLDLYINSKIFEIIDVNQSNTGEIYLLMRRRASSVLIKVGQFVYFVNAIAIIIAHFIANSPFVDMNEI